MLRRGPSHFRPLASQASPWIRTCRPRVRRCHPFTAFRASDARGGCSAAPRGGVMRDGVVVIPRLHPSMSGGPRFARDPAAGKPADRYPPRVSPAGAGARPRGPARTIQLPSILLFLVCGGAGAAPRPVFPRPSIRQASDVPYRNAAPLRSCHPRPPIIPSIHRQHRVWRRDRRVRAIRGELPGRGAKRGRAAEMRSHG
jgi:hypothetical protein